jgi:siroheme synthase
MRAALAGGAATSGVVWLIETPQARDLLSLRAARALAEAETLVLGEGVDPAVAALARRDAPQWALAAIDAAFLAREASEGRQTAVVANIAALRPLAAALAALGAPHRRLDPAPDA